MKKQAIISFANANGRYLQNLARLGESLRNNFTGDFLGFVGESAVGAPLHSDNPYAFKVYCIDKAKEQGYTQVLWLDTSCFAIKNVKPIFDEIDRSGYIMQEAGHMAGTWCNDHALNWFGLTREQAMAIPMYGNAGFLGLNFESEIANVFFNRWKESMLADCFKGDWADHRHDMVCGSIIANQLGMKYQKGSEWLQYAGVFDETANDTIIIKAQG